MSPTFCLLQKSAMRLFLSVIVLGWVGILVGQQDVARVWSDATGSYKIEAVLVGHDETSVELRRVDNSEVVTVPVNKLCDSDREFLRKLDESPSGETGAQLDQTPWLKKEKWVVYHVNMKATMTVPANRDLKLLQMRHALPTPRPWSSGSDETPGALDISFAPDTGKQKYDKKENSHYVVYDTKKGIEPGTKHEFNTRFDVVSCEREFSPAASKTTWEDYGKPKRKAESTMLPDDLRKWIAEIRANHTPAEVVAKFCEWNVKNLTYDASVTFFPSQIDSTLAAKRGHCGHYCELTAEFCKEAGIPSRRVFGLNLYEEDGDGDLSRIRTDYTNVHTWIEVHLPKEGWIELEPADAENPFRIPARFIQNNPEIQNYELAYKEGSKTEIHQYQPGGAGGSFRSPFDFGNLITYSVESISDPYAKTEASAIGAESQGK